MDAFQWQLGQNQVDLTRKTYIMGILNVTPDSFSDGGRYQSVSLAIDRVAQMLADGADLIDVGGESTRPGAQEVEMEEELERVLPIVEALAKRFEVPISVDTYKAAVADQALQAGAHLINDVWGGRADPEMVQVAARTGSPIILMHNRHNMDYVDFIQDVMMDLQQSIDHALVAGVKRQQIMIDPGIGFAKTYDHNLIMMRKLDLLKRLGYPILLGTSRKSLIGHTLQLPPEERVEGTIATVCLGITKGCHMVRVHDVKQVSRAVKMMDVMLGKDKGVVNG